MTGYRPMTLADLASHLVRTADSKTQWKLVWEFLEEYRWEPEDVQPSLLRDEPPLTGDERWDALLAARWVIALVIPRSQNAEYEFRLARVNPPLSARRSAVRVAWPGPTAGGPPASACPVGVRYAGDPLSQPAAPATPVPGE